MVALPIASLFGKILASIGINMGVNMLQRTAWAEKDGLEDKAGYIFDPEQMMVDFGNGMNIGITVPQLVAMKFYEQPKPREGMDVDPPENQDYDQKKWRKIIESWSDEDIECFNKLTSEEQKIYLEAISKEEEITETLKQIVLDNGGYLEGLENRIKTPS